MELLGCLAHRCPAMRSQAEGDLWRALGVLVAGGALRTAVLMLRRLGLPDTAAAFAAACAEAGLRNPRAPADAGASSCHAARHGPRACEHMSR